MLSKSAIDFEHLRKYTAGDMAVEREILSVFVQQADIWIRMLQDSGGDDAWSDAAHSLKGSARGVGAWQVAEICERAESLGTNGATPAERSIALGDLKSAIASAISCIDQHISQAGAA